MSETAIRLPYGNSTRDAVANEAIGALEKALACLAATWAHTDGIDHRQLQFVSAPQLRLAPHAACAVDLVRLLEQSPRGREALRDLGFQGFLQHIEGE